ncbi:4746_t:CDS:2, partial [Funneliformis geosporum]
IIKTRRNVQALSYPAFWKNNVNPSLKKFLDFRFHAGDLEDPKVEHYRYQSELNTISKYYSEVSEIGQQVLKWKSDFKEDKRSDSVKLFWNLQDVVMESELIDEKSILQWNRSQETSSAVQKKQISIYTTASPTKKKGNSSSTKMVLREKRKVDYTEPETDSDSYEEKKPKKPKRVGTTSNTHSQSSESQPPRTPLQAPWDLSPLMTTPNKRPFEKELSSEIGEELAIELFSVRDANPTIWTPDLEEYINTVLKETGIRFKTAVQVNVPDELFRLYWEKVLLDFYNLVDINPTMDRNIGERKFITYQISSILKFYERTFLNLNLDWIESHASSAKITKSTTNSGIVKVDSRAIRRLDGQEVWHMETVQNNGLTFAW